MKRLLLAAVAALSLAGPAGAAGLFPGLQIEGGAAYCAGTNIGSALTGSQCAPQVPAGPTTPSGQAYLPIDQQGLNQAAASGGAPPQTTGLAASAMGFGPTITNTTAGNVTIPNNTPVYVENVGNTSATITLPAAPQPYQVQVISIATAQTTSVLVGASAGQTCIPACPFTSSIVAAGSVLAYRWYPGLSTWIKVE